MRRLRCFPSGKENKRIHDRTGASNPFFCRMGLHGRAIAI
jgi:hypothetical protein